MDLAGAPPTRSRAGAVLRELAEAMKNVATSGIMAWALYASILQIMAVAPSALAAAIFGRITQWLGQRVPWLAIICVVLMLWWAQIRARGGARGVLHGIRVWLLQQAYSWSVAALVVFAIVVAIGSRTQSIAELRWLRDTVFLAVDILVLIACRLGYQRVVGIGSHGAAAEESASARPRRTPIA